MLPRGFETPSGRFHALDLGLHTIKPNQPKGFQSQGYEDVLAND